MSKKSQTSYVALEWKSMRNGEKPKTDGELRRYIADMRRFSKRTASSKEESLRFLVKAGIATPKGNLKQVYR